MSEINKADLLRKLAEIEAAEASKIATQVAPVVKFLVDSQGLKPTESTGRIGLDSKATVVVDDVEYNVTIYVTDVKATAAGKAAKKAQEEAEKRLQALTEEYGTSVIEKLNALKSA